MKTLAMLTLLAVLQVGCSGKSKTEDETRGHSDETKGHSKGVIKGRPKPVSMADKQAVSVIEKLGGKVTTAARYDGTSYVDSRGLRTIGRQQTVVKVRLSGPNVTDAALVHLRGLKDLYDLSLSKSSVSDAGLVHLKGLTKLRILRLDGTKVTDAAVKKLQATLPKCEIFR